ncbi:hypothetical protein [Mycobacterium sp. 852002-53434_SCH5985345]|uniref:hypothetical protein n=1 Tax=Mycobacterium sp. 852002-53434_SCH5985345 TaxID=1834107 RepID=UPI000AADE01F|nr:hypothetical protein [Mycobacterium sp. 852002-53434_SCH5985345]
MARLAVSPLDVNESRFDLFIGSIGYERRASHAITQLMPQVEKVIAAPFNENQVLNYPRNFDLFCKVGKVISGGELYKGAIIDEVRDWVDVTSARRKVTRQPFRVCVDISSMNRLRLAETILALFIEANVAQPMEVSWVYSVARFDRRLLDTGPVKFNDAIPGFEGWGDPMTPLHAIVGLGLEGDLALGVLDELEAADTTVFEPMGFSSSYDQRISARNRDFASGVPSDKRFSYNVTEPYTSFLTLSGVVADLTSVGRVVILPLGPKLFALMSLLIAAAEQERITIWRLSADTRGDPVDRKAAGPILGLNTFFSP